MELIDDLTALSDINEDIILQHLKQRFLQDKTYTLVGDVLIAANPYKQLDIYDNPATATSRAHVHSISAIAYDELKSTETDQCFVISGESGSGKTETCKHIIRHLTHLSTGDCGLEQRIMQTNPLLEAFGNAKTAMNNNSSRFGKYLQLKFVNGRMVGAKANEYLLEKSRVVKQNEGETNFHVFYWLLDGLDGPTADKLHLHGRGQFRYISSFVPNGSSHVDNVRMFKELRECFDLVGFREDEQYSIIECLAAILHLGNIDILETDHGFADIDSNSPSLLIAAQHLGIDSVSLKQLITISVSLARAETIHKHLSKTKAEAARDAVAKATYDRLFRWVVNQINRLLAPDIEYIQDISEIGILDIFGFEDFKKNSFEQLCINIANEKLHQFFTDHIFQQELSEYMEEGIKGLQLEIRDNTQLLGAFLTGSSSVFSMLDDQLHVPGATDVSFLQKINSALKKDKFYISPKSTSQGKFGVRHYAGEVTYSVDQFLDKNSDPVPSGAKGILQNSENQLINLLFRASISSTGTLCISRTSRNRISAKRSPGRRDRKTSSNTISSYFKHSLNSLVSKMTSTVPHFIRCLKPNKDKVSDVFDESCVRRQLLYTGIADTVRIRRDGYGYRPTFEEFNIRFSRGTECSVDADIQCQMTLAECGIQPSQYAIGCTKVFLKHHHLEVLNRYVRNKEKSAILIQAIVRGYLQKCKYEKLLMRKEEEERRVGALLREIGQHSDEIVECLERLERVDEERLRKERRKSEFILFKERCPPLPPPSGLYQLPPPPDIHSDDDNEQGDDVLSETNAENDLLKSFELIDCSNDQQKRLSYQSRVLKASISVSYSWLFGMLAQKKAELLLKDRPAGTFLVRVNRKKLTYILTYRTGDGSSCRHVNIVQLPNMRYQLSGETTAHASLEDLVCYHGNVAMTTTGDVLKLAYIENPERLEVIVDDAVFVSV